MNVMQIAFIQPMFFWALAGLAIPVLMHLVLKRRSRQVHLGTLRFLKTVLQANARSRNLKRWLLLALRLTCVALLVGLFARPYLQGHEESAARQFLVILIDQSASMERRGSSGRLIDQAVAEARRIVAATEAQRIVIENGNAADLHVAYFDHQVRPIEVDEKSKNDTTSLLKQLKAPANLTGTTNYSAAMVWAADVCLRSQQKKRRVILLTDLQRVGLAWSEVEPLPPGVEVQVVDLGQPQTINAAISAIKLPATVIRPRTKTAVTVTVFNAGPFPLEKAEVVLHATRGDQQVTLRQQVSVEAGSTGLVEFETPELDEGLWRGYAELQHEDDLAFDNKRWFAVLVAAPLATLIVEGQPNDLPQRTAAYYLETSLRLAPPGDVAPERLFEPTVLALKQGVTLPDLSMTSLVVLANVPSLTQADATRLSTWVRAGGGLLVFAGEPTTAEGLDPLIEAGLGVGTVTGFSTSNDVPWRLETWSADHPIFEPFGDVQRGELARTAFRGISPLEPSSDATVLARFTGGAPAVIERMLDRGRVIWFAAGCDGTWSDWPRSRLFLPLNYQLLSDLGGLLEGGPVRENVIDNRSAVDLVPGVFAEGPHWNTINVSPRESETDRCTVEEFANRFGFDPAGPTSTELRSLPLLTAGLDVRNDELWAWVLAGLLGLFLAEGFLANRTTS